MNTCLTLIHQWWVYSLLHFVMSYLYINKDLLFADRQKGRGSGWVVGTSQSCCNGRGFNWESMLFLADFSMWNTVAFCICLTRGAIWGFFLQYLRHPDVWGQCHQGVESCRVMFTVKKTAIHQCLANTRANKLCPLFSMRWVGVTIVSQGKTILVLRVLLIGIT